MHGKRVIRQFIACLLIIVFSQKMGMGLYLHNWLHSSSSHEVALTGDELKNACSCINDFTAPLDETCSLDLFVPIITAASAEASPVLGLPVPAQHFCSLRAPPFPLS